MPGVGKSTAGVLLAKATGRDFVDTDVWIQAREGASLPELLARHGRAGFLELEERHVLALDARNAVIATGGSVVYGARAVSHLRAHGHIVHLTLALPALEARLGEPRRRAASSSPRARPWPRSTPSASPLYEHCADATLDTAGLSHEAVVVALRGRW